MRALNGKRSGGDSAAPAGLRVLPRLLRRPVRFCRRFAVGHIAVPRHAETILFSAVIGGAIVYGAALGGQLSRSVETLTAAVGFGVKEIELSGNIYTPADDVFSALGLNARTSLVSIDPVDARAALAQLPWVAETRIAKVYPSRLVVEVTERTPFAIWQAGDAIAVVEQDGAVIGGFAGDPRLAALPILVGKGAAERGADFIQTLARYPVVAERVRAYILVGERRWNLRLDNGITVRLPEVDVEVALARLMTMQADLDVLGRDLAAIDLRFDDRTVFALTDNALRAHEAAAEARTEAMKARARGRSI